MFLAVTQEASSRDSMLVRVTGIFHLRARFWDSGGSRQDFEGSRLCRKFLESQENKEGDIAAHAPATGCARPEAQGGEL